MSCWIASRFGKVLFGQFIYICDGGIVRNLDVSAHGHNNDGIDLEMTRNFLVEHCTFNQGDDAVVIYQWKNLVLTHEGRITRIDGITLKNVVCDEADGIYELKGDIRLPIRNVRIEDVHVGRVKEFFKKVNNVGNVTENNITVGISVEKNSIPLKENEIFKTTDLY